MYKKLLIISRNSVPVQFWSNFIETKDVTIWKWEDSSSKIPDIKNESPQMVIIDDYFGLPINDIWVEEILGQVFSTGYDQEVLCISPRFNDPSQRHGIRLSQVKCYPFCRDLIYHIRNSAWMHTADQLLTA